MKSVTAQQMKEIDRRTIEEYGMPSLILMENAGKEASRVARSMLSNLNKKVMCICGKGNNGGDGFVCARHLINSGVETDIFLTGELQEPKEDSKLNFSILKKMKIDVMPLITGEDFEFFKDKLKEIGLLVDAIFGIGLSGKVKEPYSTIIDLMNESRIPILAIDVPSGLDATGGSVLGACIKATKTITFGLPKTGFFKNQGPLYVGELITADISIPKQLLT